MTARPDVVCLLIDLHPDLSEPMDCRYVHKDGRSFTDAETALATGAGVPEWDAASDYFDAADHQREGLADFDRLDEILGLYWAEHGRETPLGDLIARLTDAERAEVTAIIDRIAPEL